MFKTTRKSNRLLNTTAITRIKRVSALALAGVLTSTAAFAINDNALPEGGTVASGSANFDYSGNNLNVNQDTNRVVIDWTKFNIGKDASTRFYQPGTNSVAVNRVHDVDPSQILGKLSANGQLVILNTNGVFFGQSAQVDVSGLLVSTGKIDADLFMSSGKVNLSDINLNSAAQIVNEGQITIQNAGLAAFVAPSVANSGIIEARLGKIALAAGGNTATVDLYGDGLVEMALDANASKALINNTGTLKADGGKIAVTAKAASGVVDSVINMGGIVEANTVGTRNGKIVLGATNANIVVSGKVNAKGGKGEVDVRSNQKIATTSDSEINVDGGNGKAVLWGDVSTLHLGLISALGANGFVETSGGKLGVHGSVRLGTGGEWLLDPTDLDIVHGNGDGGPTDSSIFSVDDSANDSWYWVGDNQINSVLNTGNNVTLRTHDNGTGAGNITMHADAVIDKTTGGDATLTLEAHNDISILGIIKSTLNKLNVVLRGDYDNSGGDADVFIRNNISTNGGYLLVDTADDIDITNGAVISTADGGVSLHTRGTGDGSWVWMPGSSESVGAGTINSGSGNISIKTGKFTLKGGSSLTSAGGVINIENTGVADVDANTITNSANGTIYISQNAGGSIQAVLDALNNSSVGSTYFNFVKVGDGVYNENIAINKSNVWLTSENGRDHVTINGIAGVGALGTIVVGNNVNNVAIGALAGSDSRGFKIVGFDNGVPAVENAAVYLQGAHNAFTLVGNEVVANGDLAFLTEYNAINTSLNIHSNTFSGKTYQGATWATGSQFVDPNVSRQLVVISPGASVITFANNIINGDSGANTQVTIDGNDANIFGNKFQGTTTGGFSLRARGTKNWIDDNTFSAAGLSGTAQHLLVKTTAYTGVDANHNTIKGVFLNNDFTNGVTSTNDIDAANDYVLRTIQGGIDISNSGADVLVSKGTYNESVNVNKLVHLKGANAGISASNGSVRNPESIVDPNSPGFYVTANGASIDGFEVTGADVGIHVNGASNVVISNNIVHDVDANGIYFANAANGDANNNYVYNTGSNGHGIAFEGSVNGGSAKNNKTKHTGYNGIYSTGGTGMQITGNTITDSGYFTDSNPGVVTHGISIENGSGLIAANIIDDAAHGILLYNTTGASQVWGNTVSNTSHEGILAENASGADIQNNVVYNTGKDGIALYNSGKSLVAGNRIGFIQTSPGVFASAGDDNIKGDGILIVNSDGDATTQTIVQGNTITQTHSTAFDKGSGIQVLNSDYVSLLTNTMTDTGWDYIRLDAEGGSIDHIIVISNTGNKNTAVDGAERVGLYAEGLTNSSIIGNTFNDTNRYAGIYASGGSNFDITGNIINNADEVGILVKNAGGIVKVEANSIKNTGLDKKASDGENNGDAIRIVNVNGAPDGADAGTAYDAGAIVRGNTIGTGTVGNINGNGISIVDSSYAVVDGGNWVNNTVQDGISVTNSNFTNILKNQVGLLGGANSIGSGVGGGDAIFVSNSDNVTIKGNKTANTHYNGPLRKGSGILVVKSDNAVIGGVAAGEANEIALAGSDGIVVRTDGDTANNNKIIGNKITGIAGSRTGIYTENATNTLIDQNIVSGTGRWAAIYGYGGSDFTITGNTVSNNEEQGIRLENASGVNKINTNLINKTGTAPKASDGSNSGDAIYAKNVAGLTVSGNTIGYNEMAATSSAGDNNVKGHGINVITSTGAKVLINKISGVTLDGIHVENTNDLEVTGNQIKAFGSTTEGADGRGIYVLNGTSALIDGNVIRGGDGAGGNAGKKGSGGNAIHIDNNDFAEVYGNTIQGGDAKSGTGNVGGSGSGGHGIYVTGSQAAKIGANGKGNKILAGNNQSTRNGGMGADKAGIYAENNAGTNTTQAHKDGIYIGYNEINGNARVDAVGDDGIYVINSANSTSGTDGAKAVIEWNTVSDVGNTTDDDGIDVRGTDRVQILNNTIDQVAGNGIRLNPSHDALIDLNTIWNIGVNGINVLSSNNVDVTNNKLHEISNHGIYAETSNDLYIFNNTIGNGTAYGAKVDGIHVNGGRKAVIDLNTIQGGKGVILFGAGNDGIHVVNNREAVISNNTIQGGQTTTISIPFVGNIEIPGAAGAANHGIYVDNSGAIIGGGLDAIAGQFRDGVQITGNKILNDGIALGALKDGIHVINSASGLLADRALVQLNTVRGVGNDGIFVNSTNGAIIDQNNVSLAGDDGIDVSGSSLVEITNNTVSTVLDNGIILDGGLVQLIEGNTVTLAGNDGINVNNVGGLTINDNTVAGVGVDGIDVRNVIDADITNNNVSVALTGHGIFVDPSVGVNISGNTVLGVALDGIHALDILGLTINGNTVGLTGDDGIEANNVVGFEIASNTVFLTGDNGIELNNVGVGTVHNNVIVGTTNDGINANNVAAVSINNNLIALTGDNGIEVNNAALIDVSDNFVALTGNNGITLTNVALADVSGNTTLLTTNDGIKVTNAALLNVANNNVFLAGDDGIDLENVALANVSGNTVVGTTNNGIEVDNAALLNVSGNFVTLTGDNGIALRNVALANVSGNTTLLTAGDGIEVTNAALLNVANNNVFLAGDDGIDLENVALANVSGNTVAGTINNGIEVDNAALLNVSGNFVTLTGDNGIALRNVALANVSGNTTLLTLGDGIEINNAALLNVSGNNVLLAGDDGIDLNNVVLANVSGNNVAGTINNGIEVSNAVGALVSGNTVFLTGGNGIDLRNTIGTVVAGNTTVGTFGDGIHVENSILSLIAGNTVILAGGDGIDIENAALVAVAGNTVIGTLGNGIEVSNAAGVLVAGNTVFLAGGNGIDLDNTIGTIVAGNTVVGTLGDGIHVDNSALSLIAGNTTLFTLDDGIDVNNSTGIAVAGNNVAFAGDDGIDIDNSDYVAVIGNDVDYVLGNGIEYSDSQYGLIGFNNVGQNGFVGGNGVDIRDSRDVLVAGNTIGTNVQQNGIFIDPSFDVALVNNTIDRVGAYGIYVQGLGNGKITLAGNKVTSDVGSGARFESGEIDMTGAANTFDGGVNGLEFDGPEVKLTNDTLGTTVFTNQAQYYVALSNGALFNPGTPTLIDASQVSFDGVVVGSNMLPPALAYLEGKLFDYDDTGLLGQIFFATPSLFNVDQNDILPEQRLALINARYGGSVTIIGLPYAQLPRQFGSLNINNLNDITPAAGGTPTTTEVSAIDLNAIDTAAGGENANCWSQVYSHLSGSASPVSFSLSGAPASMVAAQAACGI